MTTLKTTTRALREGLAVRAGMTIAWPSTGYLSAQLLDASGQVPLAGREVRVEIPGEGPIALVADPDGRVFHPDVPFQDYELDLGERVRVWVPAVANRDEVHARHVAEVVYGFARLQLRDSDGGALTGALTLRGPAGTLELSADADGAVQHATPIASGDYQLELARGDGRHYSAKLSLANRRGEVLIATLTAEAT